MSWRFGGSDIAAGVDVRDARTESGETETHELEEEIFVSYRLSILFFHLATRYDRHL